MMLRAIFVALLVAVASTSGIAQTFGERCATPDTVVVRGAVRTSPATVLNLAGISRGVRITGYPQLQRAIESVYATGDYADVQIWCDLAPDGSHATMLIDVAERPTLANIRVEGPEAVTKRSVEERIELLVRRPVDPALITRGIARIDSLYEAAGYYLVRVVPETTVVAPGSISLTFRVIEGPRLAISGIRIEGNRALSARSIVGALKTRPEAFWWFRRGAYDPDVYAGDLGERLPQFFSERGYIDFQLLHDTLAVDRERGKGVISLELREGERYKVGTFSVIGNQRFTDAQLQRYYPFGEAAGPTLTERAIGVVRGRKRDPDAFDFGRWRRATDDVSVLYLNEGYLSARVAPIMERTHVGDTAVVNLRWEIVEGAQSIVNRVDIVGNEFTTESCIRDLIQVYPGDVFSRDRVIRSIQMISNLGLFEPLSEPGFEPANAEGDLIDVIFKVKEKRTGNFSFGASMGQGVGLGGYIGVEHPNLFGRCKKGSLNWQFGRYINDFNLAYTDPAISGSRITGTVNAYRSQARYQIADLGQTTRTGGSVRVGMPIRGAIYTRAFVSYTGEAVKYGSSGLLGTVSDCNNCFRSALGLDITRDNRFGLPFPIGGALYTAGAQFNGGPLGGSANFQRYTLEARSYAPLASIGGNRPGSQPMSVVLGLSARSGAVFGGTGPFFFSQRFALGGVQFGEPLRGYPEFSITPNGFLTGTSTYNARRESFGSAFFASTAEIGLRINAQVYVNLFYDAGNVWERPREFDPTRLYRGAGLGLSTLTPLGPLGLDWAYGFDRLDAAGRRDPRWQLHFRLGQLF
jgi:outer membrane protein insertion porin family